MKRKIISLAMSLLIGAGVTLFTIDQNAQAQVTPNETKPTCSMCNGNCKVFDNSGLEVYHRVTDCTTCSETCTSGGSLYCLFMSHC